MVCPSSRDCSDAKSFCTCFTSLLVLGRQGGAADDSTGVEKEEDIPAFLEPTGFLTTLEMLTPNYLRASAWPRRLVAQLAESS
jgi:hypothetical protein